jgi:hypothetical protein
MNDANPTPLRLGMKGALAGKNYRIAGRVVMSMDEAGETYYWNEFNLIGDDGQCATLVYEEGENGPVWRVFTLIDPAVPLTAADVAGKRVGDPVDFGEGSFHVTCVDESRVCAIEGEAPEGVERGDIAHYFNAECGNRMIVVSWTGDEVEIYRGITLPAHAVASAFGVSAVPSGALNYLSKASSDGGSKRISGVSVLVVVVIAVVFIVTLRSGCMPVERAERPPELPPAQLSIGREGKLNAAQYRITGHAVVEVAHVGKRYIRHEYSVVDEAGNEAILWQGTEQGADKWMLATPFTPPQPLTPADAGGLRLGQAVVFDEAGARVTDLFLSRIGKVDGTSNWTAGTELYGFMARSQTPKETLVALWNGTSITFYRAAPTAEKNPAKSFR